MTTPTDDRALMLRYRDGDVAAFETLYRRHNHSLYRYLLRLCLHRQTAEDLYQEVWSRIIRSRRRYRPTAKFSTYLYRIARNCFVDSLRRDGRRPIAGADDPADAADPGAGPDVEADRRILRARLLSALAALPVEQRDAFVLHEEAGLTLDEIAAVTGVSRETAKSRLRYAKSKLRLSLADTSAEDTATTGAADSGMP